MNARCGGHLFAAVLPAAADYPSDVVHLTIGTTVFGITLIVLAITGGLVVTGARRRRAELLEPQPS